MENEVITSPPLRSSFEEALWANRQTLGNKPLTLKHVAPSFVILVSGVIISLIIFSVECFLFLYERKTSVKPATDNRSSATVADENIDIIIIEVDEIKEHHNMEE